MHTQHPVLSAALAALCLIAPACSSSVRVELAPEGWAQDLGRGEGLGVAVHASGDVLVTGTLAAGAPNILAAALDAETGSERWRTRFEAAGAEPGRGRGVAIAGDAAGNVVVTGYFSGELDFGGGPLSTAGINNHHVFVVKLDRDGRHVWSRSFGDDAAPHALVSTGAAVAIDAGGNVVVTGYYAGAVDFGGGPLPAADVSNGFVVKLGPGGDPLWSRQCGDRGSTAVAVDAEGNVILAGDFETTFACGAEPLESAGSSDVAVVKLDPSGAPRWARRFGDAAWQSARSLAVDAAGAVIVAGAFSGAIDLGDASLAARSPRDAFVVKLGPGGDTLFGRGFGDPECADREGCQAIEGVSTGEAGEILMTGWVTGAVDFGGGPLESAGDADVVIAALDPRGEHLYSGRFGDARAQRGGAVAAYGGGELVVAGSFDGALRLAGPALESPGRYDLFVARLAP